MENIIKSLVLHQWQRKLVALFTATVIWFFVNQTIIATKTIPSVPVRVINLPNDQTIIGLLPNGFLSKRMTLTLTGTKNVIDQLEPGDLEVLLDVSNRPNEGGITITKKNLVSLNPSINLNNHITSVDHLEYILKMSPLLTENIPIIIQPPLGEAPKGYNFLDIWPMTLTQKVSGPHDQVLQLKQQGLELTFDLNNLTKEQLDALQPDGVYDDVVNFNVPDEWKKISIPLPIRTYETVNDPDAKYLHISFLRKQLIPLNTELPIHVFYPLKNSQSINPQTYTLALNKFVKLKNDIPVLSVPLYIKNVSKLFLEIVNENLELEIVTAPKNEREKLEWSVGFIDSSHLEDTYVAFLLSHSRSKTRSNFTKSKERETYLRQRFRNYMRNFNLFLSPQHKLEIDSVLEDNHIKVHVPNASLRSN